MDTHREKASPMVLNTSLPNNQKDMKLSFKFIRLVEHTDLMKPFITVLAYKTFNNTAIITL